MAQNCKLLLNLAGLILLAASTTWAQGADALVSRAKEAIDRQSYDAALNDLNEAIKLNPKSDAAYAQKARVYVRQNKLDVALAEAEKALKINPKNYEALNARGVAKRDHLKDKTGALDDFNNALTIKPDYYFAALNQGITLNDLGRPNDALAAFRKAIEIDPGIATAYERRGFLLMSSMKYKEALKEFDKAISLNDKNDASLAARAFCSLRGFSGDLQLTLSRAKADAEKALGLNPNNSLALGVRGLVRYEEKNEEGALADADRSIQLNPKSYLGFMTRGFIKYDNKDYEGSLDELEKALSLSPRNDWIRQKRDIALDRATSPRAQALKAEIRAAKEEAVESELESAKKNVADNPWDFRSYDVLSDAFGAYSRIKGGDSWMETRAYWEKLLSENPNNLCATRFLGEYKGAKYFMDMINFLDDGLRRYDGKNGTECAAQIAFRIGREYADRNRYKEADAYFSKAKQLQPDLKYLEGNIAANSEKKAEDDRFRAEMDAATVRIPPGGLQQPTSPSTKKNLSPLEKTKVAQAVAEYQRVHDAIERDLNEWKSAVNKYASAGGYRYLYKGTYERITNIERRMLNRIWDLLKAHGDYLPTELLNHIKEDEKTIIDSKIPSPWQ